MDDFGSDFITITDEDGVEYELEILSELDYQGAHYLAVVPATSPEEEEPEELEVSLLRAETASPFSPPSQTPKSWRLSIS